MRILILFQVHFRLKLPPFVDVIMDDLPSCGFLINERYPFPVLFKLQGLPFVNRKLPDARGLISSEYYELILWLPFQNQSHMFHCPSTFLPPSPIGYTFSPIEEVHIKVE